MKTKGYTFMYNENIDFTTYWKTEPTCKVTVRGLVVEFENLTNDPLKLPFGILKEVDRDKVEGYFKDRCFPEDRVNCKELIRDLGLDYYEPELICRKTHGLQFDDFCWIQFADEPQVTYDEIKLR